MVPYANRIAGNQFTFAGHVWRFAANNQPERLNVHGTGWQSLGPSKTRKQPRRPRVGPYCSEGTLVLPGHSAVRPLAGAPCTYHDSHHLDSWAMPFGFGQHPWFEREPAVTVAFRAAQFWMEGPEGCATDPISMTPELDFAVSRCLPGTWRNNDYGGWDGRAEIRFPSRGLGPRIQAEPVFSHLMLSLTPPCPTSVSSPRPMPFVPLTKWS